MSWKKFTYRTCIFFIPVIIGYAILEGYTRNLPLAPKIKSEYYKKHQDSIEILVLGASQNRDAINPKFLSQKTLNLAFPNQDYYVNSKLLEQIGPTLPSLKTVIIPISYGHFETAPNQKESWKNSIYRYYFGATISSKFTYFKDSFLYLSFPGYYSGKIKDYKKGQLYLDCNEYGYNRNITKALFYRVDYDSIAISKQTAHITPSTPHPEYILENAKQLENIIRFCAQQQYQVILLETPTTKRFKQQRISQVLHRKDSILSVVKVAYNIRYINTDLNNDYSIKDYRDNNHLSPQGAEKFTKRLNKIIK